VNALNQGLEESTSELIARMDSDDEMHPARLLEQVSFLDNRDDIGLVATMVKHVPSGDHDTRGHQNYVNWTNTIISSRDISTNRFIESPFAHPSVMFRKELISRYGGYQNGDFPEDYELWLRLLRNNVKMEKINKVFLKWRDHENRLSRNDTRYSLKAFQQLKARYLKYWIHSNISPLKPIHAWGAGKHARKQLHHLRECGIEIKNIYDVDSKKINSTRNDYSVIHYKDVPPPGVCFILVLVGGNKARKEVNDFLCKRCYKIEKDYMLLA
jgi:glycosyltransferase involved in cell wall biosynthesis